ncbi:MAG: ATP-binding cassette domain-containing protein [Proteobacteria bacterium]|nr:ATP-binding cassette domain-containing protein [Pseudomonadota bacterium]MCZ6744035.1 ABC transporter ATP-binding protein [Alphaproteobacteria bacterium]
MLRIRGLTRPGLEPFDFDLPPGEAVAMFGPSGAGKTLLLRAIADLDPNDGACALGDARRDDMPAPDWRRLVTYMAAEPGWWGDRVGDHFADPDSGRKLLPPLKLPEDAMGWALARLSTGEKQRLALARVLERAPRVMLLDEPTSGLDADTTRAVEAVLGARLGDGAAMLFVTHDIEQGKRLAKRALYVDAGKVRQGDL